MLQVTGDFHRQAIEAEEGGQFLRAVQVAAEIIRNTPADFTAKRVVARNLGKMGRENLSAQVYGQLCTELISHGFVVTAIEVCNEAIRLCPGEFDLIHNLNDVFEMIDQEKVVTRALVAPPSITSSAANVAGESCLNLVEEDVIVSRALELCARNQSASSENSEKRGIPFFSGLSRDSFVSLVSEIETRNYAAGENIFEQDSAAQSMYIILSGSVEVLRDGEQLATLKAGSILGEIALVTAQPRSATARAKYDTTVFEITADDIERVASDHPTISTEIAKFTRKRILLNVMSLSPFFQPLKTEHKRDALAMFNTQIIQNECELVTEGQQSDKLFVVASGECVVVKSGDTDEHHEVARLACGDVFGEISLVREMDATATVLAQSGTVVLSLNRERFKTLTQKYPEVAKTLDDLSAQRLEEMDDFMMLESVEVADDDFIML
ncbi:MAG: cyclic nucleotide-binding domain-containing protein [Myxococcota bacterium]|nr:cyclic nucleotide-binding domain-containing protein [Myxococcota bacterium]